MLLINFQESNLSKWPLHLCPLHPHLVCVCVTPGQTLFNEDKSRLIQINSTDFSVQSFNVWKRFLQKQAVIQNSKLFFLARRDRCEKRSKNSKWSRKVGKETTKRARTGCSKNRIWFSTNHLFWEKHTSKDFDPNSRCIGFDFCISFNHTNKSCICSVNLLSPLPPATAAADRPIDSIRPQSFNSNRSLARCFVQFDRITAAAAATTRICFRTIAPTTQARPFLTLSLRFIRNPAAIIDTSTWLVWHSDCVWLTRSTCEARSGSWWVRFSECFVQKWLSPFFLILNYRVSGHISHFRRPMISTSLNRMCRLMIVDMSVSFLVEIGRQFS